MSDKSPTALAPALERVPARAEKSYPLVTGGLDPEFDALGVCLQALNELSSEQQRRVISYLYRRVVDAEPKK